MGAGGGRKRARGGAPRFSLLALALVGFVAVAIGVISRRSYAYRQNREIKALEAQRDSLRDARVQTEAAIRNASGRARLVPVVEERLRMRTPKPEQQIILPRPRLPDTPLVKR